MADLRDFDVPESVPPAPRASAFRRGVRASSAAMPAADVPPPPPPSQLLPEAGRDSVSGEAAAPAASSAPLARGAGSGVVAGDASGWAESVTAVRRLALGGAGRLAPMPSTQSAPSFSAAALADAEAATAAVETHLLAALDGGALTAGDVVELPAAGGRVRLGRVPAPAELRRLRRDFERLSTTDAVLGGGPAGATGRFLAFLETSLAK